MKNYDLRNPSVIQDSGHDGSTVRFRLFENGVPAKAIDVSMSSLDLRRSGLENLDIESDQLALLRSAMPCVLFALQTGDLRVDETSPPYKIQLSKLS